MTSARKLKIAVIREEYVAVVKTFPLAVVLNQMLYWQERVKDIDKYLSAERDRYRQGGQHPPMMSDTDGWFYKSADDLIEETMLGCARKSMLRYLDSLIEMGYVKRRRNPDMKWDRTYQYQIDLYKLRDDLHDLNYHLPGWQLDEVPAKPASDIESHGGDIESLQRGQDVTAIPETTPEIKDKNIAPKVSEKKSKYTDEEYKAMYEEILSGSPHERYLRRFATMLADQNVSGTKSPGALYKEVAVRYKAAREKYSDAALTHAFARGFDRDIQIGSFQYFVTIAKSYKADVTELRADPLALTPETAEIARDVLSTHVDRFSGRPKLERFATLANKVDFMSDEEPHWTIMKKFGNTEDEKQRNLNSCRLVVRRAVREAKEKSVG